MEEYKFEINLDKLGIKHIREELRKGKIRHLINELRIAIEKEKYEEASGIKRVLEEFGVN